MLLHGGRYVLHAFLSFLITYYFQENGSLFPTFQRIALDFLPCLASSVACECLFLSGGEIAMKSHVQLGADQFEELQIMKFVWQVNIEDLACWNLSQVEEIDFGTKKYEDLLACDIEHAKWDQTKDEILSLLVD
jgi:hypothetical protein